MNHDLVGHLPSILLGLALLFGCHQAPAPPSALSGPPAGAFDADKLLDLLESVPTALVRSTFHQLIDLQVSVIKTKLDIAIGAWESLDRDQRRALLPHWRDGFDRLQGAVSSANGTAAAGRRVKGGDSVMEGQMKTAIVGQWLAAAEAGSVETAEVKIIAIEAVPGHEQRVAQYLRQRGTARMAVLAKGYVVCELTRKKLDAVAAFPGVLRVLPIEDLCDLETLAEPGGDCDETFAPGDLVRIVNWASTQMVGFLRDWDGERGVVDLALFGRAIPVRVTRGAIEHVPLPDQWA